VVTHNSADIIPEITRVILLKDGNIFQDGNKEEVLTSKTLHCLFGIPLKVIQRDGYYHIT
jgi:iron complex transport system ATP-binding protein